MNKGIKNAKEFICIAGPRYNPVTVTVTLNGVLPDERLTPKMARQAARAAFGESDGAITVWSNDEYGYRLYAKGEKTPKPTHRKIRK